MSATNATMSGADIFLLSPYHYIPTQGVTLTFLILYGISTALHLSQAIWFKIWWLIPTAVLAGIGETIGWVGRYWSSRNFLDSDAFLMQITTTIISPTPLLAANFIIFAQLTSVLGTQYSRLSPRWYARIFLTSDIIALVVQALGGGLASSTNSQSTTNLGANIALAGIVFQLASLIVFSALMAEFFVRFWNHRPLRDVASNSYRGHQWNLKLKLATFGLAFSSTLLFIRGVYRTIELADGWFGRIIATQVYYNVLDGAMVTLAMYTLNIFHPGILLADTYNQTNVLVDEKHTDETKR
ncbi:RTA1 like protein-domain-containing protein [Cytidiella melzeri]|nr:RTA1 like protein-domain-containing protein [Cytidiella melzeri]